MEKTMSIRNCKYGKENKTFQFYAFKTFRSILNVKFHVANPMRAKVYSLERIVPEDRI